jgi:hypothetical protein
MSLPSNIGDREYQKFTEDLQGEVCIRIAPGAITDSRDGNELDINDAGEAAMTDQRGRLLLSSILEKLEEIEFQLKLITGA